MLPPDDNVYSTVYNIFGVTTVINSIALLPVFMDVVVRSFGENLLLVLTVITLIIALIVGYNKMQDTDSSEKEYCNYCNKRAVREIKVCEKHEPRKDY